MSMAKTTTTPTTRHPIAIFMMSACFAGAAGAAGAEGFFTLGAAGVFMLGAAVLALGAAGAAAAALTMTHLILFFI